MGATEILVSGGVAAILAAVAGGGLKAFGVELPLLASVRRQALLMVAGVALVALGLLSGRAPAGSGSGASAAGNAAAVQADTSPDKAAPARAEQPTRVEGTRIPPVNGIQFIAARDILLRSGWSPIGQGNPMHNENVQGGNGPMFVERGYSEIVSCAPTGAAECLFVYRSDTGQVLQVRTMGEGETAVIDDAHIADCSADPKPEGC